MKVAGAPISWGVCEVAGWGRQLGADRVLADMAALDLRATELGPDGFLPGDGATRDDLLARYGLRVVAGFVALPLQDDPLAMGEVAARRLAEAGAEVLVVAAAAAHGYDERRVLDDAGWKQALAMLLELRWVAERHGLALAFHPHVGTPVEGPDDVDRFLSDSDVPLCLDTGHLFVGGNDPVAVAERAGAARVRHVHLKDVDAALAAQVRAGAVRYSAAVRRGLYRPLGRGDVAIGEVVGTLERAGYPHWYVLEQDIALDGARPAAAPLDAMRASLAFLDHLNGGRTT